MNGFSVTTDKTQFDFDVIYNFISQSYWARGIPRDTLEKAINHSLCFAVLNSEHQQVGFARLITDKSTFAYLADVFILEPYRGLGLSKLLMSTISEHSELQGLRRIMLATRDAHDLYTQFGFKPIENPHSLMQNWQPDIYQVQD
ncbi:N-acetyltransferase [Shewanella sairae]|uniref:N-acetyltransferase n=1 Tax=Shewanella sairae TaxID=190310 RepID=A0ABQ4P7H5_9GAMM|nr:GNAT family N-acetyltransferase [Shewanella sairae]MCL1128813.1 GNAT family N-acetyltransferase [Shewanella sairae]GIU43495.1 N-acetyltransferase [Shewanella sairae]